MSTQNNDFLTKLSKNLTLRIPIYCTGYPEDPFILNYCNKYHITQERDDLLLKDKNYSVIKRIGFDAISIWDFRRSAGGYFLNSKHYVDGWGRIFKNNWYSWDGVFKNQAIIDNWKHLKLPSIEDFKLLSGLIKKFEKINLIPVFSLPGLFEKTWQSMGFIFFSKCLRKENFNLIKSIIDFFFDYSMSLLKALQKYDINIFLIADDLGYKKRLFINESLWSNLFFEKYQRIIEQVHLNQRNKSKIILHSDGDITQLMDVIIKLGFDAIQSLEPDAGVDILNLFKIYGKRITFIGNISNTLLSYGTPSEVKFYIIKLISYAKKYKVYLIVSPTQQIDSKIKVDNIKALIDSTKQV